MEHYKSAKMGTLLHLLVRVLLLILLVGLYHTYLVRIIIIISRKKKKACPVDTADHSLENISTEPGDIFVQQ